MRGASNRHRFGFLCNWLTSLDIAGPVVFLRGLAMSVLTHRSGRAFFCVHAAVASVVDKGGTYVILTPNKQRAKEIFLLIKRVFPPARATRCSTEHGIIQCDVGAGIIRIQWKFDNGSKIVAISSNSQKT
jgi:hypothetical protein